MSETANERKLMKIADSIDSSARRIAIALETLVDLAEDEVTLKEQPEQEVWDDPDRVPDFMKGKE